MHNLQRQLCCFASSVPFSISNLSIKSFFATKIPTTSDEAGHPTTATTVEPTKEEGSIEMDYSDSNRKVPATKKRPSRSAKKRVVYFDKSDSELESDEDGNEASKKRSFKKKANTEPDLLHLNSLTQKKTSWPSQNQSSGKENWVSDVKMGSKAATALSFEREVPNNVSISAAVMKIFLMSQDSVDLEKPTKAEFAIMWYAMKKMHEPSVIEGSAEADNQLVEIIRRKQRAKQLPHASDRPFANSCESHNGIGMGNSWVPSTNNHVVKTAEEMQTDYPVRQDETFQHGNIPYKKDETRLAWSCAINSRISLAYAAGEDDPTPLFADIFPAHKRIGYNKQTSVKIMDDDNRDIAIFIITLMLNICRAIIIQGVDGKNILPSVFRSMGLAGVILSDKMIQHLVPDYKMTQAEYSMEGNFPMYHTFNKKTGKTCFILTCPQIGSTLVGPVIGLEGKLWTRIFIFWSASF
jgi:hypothetical protein